MDESYFIQAGLFLSKNTADIQQKNSGHLEIYTQLENPQDGIHELESHHMPSTC